MLINKVKTFSNEANPIECEHKHKLQGTGAVYYYSVGLIQCVECLGWQLIKKQIKK